MRGVRSQFKAVVVAGILLGAASFVSATTYEIGPGKTYTKLGAITWANLKPGDIVLIYWQAAGYAEKVYLSASGTVGNPITVRGVAGPNGQMPVIDGNLATTDAQFSNIDPTWTQPFGVLVVTRNTSQQWDAQVSNIVIENLDVRGGYRDPSRSTDFKNSAGANVAYDAGASPILIRSGVNITIKNCIMRDSCVGLYVLSNNSPSQNILLQGCNFYGNGVIGSYYQHQSYTEARGIIYEYCHFGLPRPGSGGSLLKDRSSGTVIRYCYFDSGGARVIDLVDSEIFNSDPEWSKSFVYGNTIINKASNGAGLMIHYGGDQGTGHDRVGTLYFYNNTVMMRGNQSAMWRMMLFDVTDSRATMDFRNNIVYTGPETTGAAATNFSILTGPSNLTAANNWVTAGMLKYCDTCNGTGTVTGFDQFINNAQNDPGFVSLTTPDFHLKAGAQPIDKGGAVAAAANAYPVTQQYDNVSVIARAVVGSSIDLGAYEATTGALSAAPQITTQPNSASVSAGATATFSVVASGTSPLTYEWKKNGTTISGATAASYITPATTIADNNASFICVVRNSAGSATSSAATLTVSPAATGRTFYVATTGADANDGSSARPWLRIQSFGDFAQPGDTLIIRAGSYAGAIFGWDGPNQGQYSQIKGTAQRPITIQADASAAAGSVIINARNSKTAIGLDLEPGCDYVNIVGIKVTNPGSTITKAGIKVAGSTGNQILNTTVDGVGGIGGIFVDTVVNVLIANNTVINTVGTGTTGHGMYLSGSSSGVTVTNNSIHNNSYVGIHVNGDVSEGLPGAVSNALIKSNLIYNNGQNGINADGIQNSVIQNNLIYGNERAGITLYQIDAFGGSINNTIVNNTIIGNGTAGSTAIRVAPCQYDNQDSQPTPAGCASAPFDSSTGNIAFNNFLIGNAGATDVVSSRDLSLSNNITANASTLFVNAAGGNYQLASNSPAINTGVAGFSGKNAPATDLLGGARPSGTAWDIGAYEFGATPAPVDPTPPSVAPTITTQPTNTTVAVGAAATFSIVAAGTPAPTYQWKKNGATIAGATSASYTTPATTSADTGAVFACVVQNTAGSVTSTGATLTVTSAPTVPPTSPTPPTTPTPPTIPTPPTGNGKTYYVATNGSDSNDGSINKPWLRIQSFGDDAKAGDTLIVRAGEYAGAIFGWDGPNQGQYSTIFGTQGNPITFKADPDAPAGSVVIRSRANKTAIALDFEPGCDYINIIGFKITNADASVTKAGIKLAGSKGGQILNNIVDGVGGIGGIFVDSVSDTVIANNTVINTLGTGTAGHGMYLSGSSSGVIVRNNSIHNNGYVGIHVNGDVSEGLPGVVSNALITSNFIYNNGQNGINADGIQNSIIQNNLIYGNERNGIVLYQIDAYGGSSNNTIVNNTILGNGSANSYALQVRECQYDGDQTPTPVGCTSAPFDSSTGNIAFNNILIGNGGATDSVSSRDLILSNNVTATASTLFVNAPAGNYQLADNSPAINQGVASFSGKNAPATDLVNGARPAGSNWDIGAYEFGSAPSPSDPTTVPTSPTGSVQSPAIGFVGRDIIVNFRTGKITPPFPADDITFYTRTGVEVMRFRGPGTLHDLAQLAAGTYGFRVGSERKDRKMVLVK